MTMTMRFADVPEDELQILLAETAEHIQTLDEGLVRLERDGNDPQLLQSIFRAAHTLKSAAGVLNHKDMASLTHALETVLDALRQNGLKASAEVTDACLDALDTLKLLHAEIMTGETQGPTPEIAPLVARLLQIGRPDEAACHGADAELETAGADTPGLLVCADIAPESAAPAARAFQVMLTLQSLGEVRALEPSPAVIESGVSVHRVTARLITRHPHSEVRRALGQLSEIVRLEIGDEPIVAQAAPAEGAVADYPAPPAGEAPRPGAPPPASPELAHSPLTDKTVRTSVERLDRLMDLVGELIADRNRLGQLRDDFESHSHNGSRALEENLAQTVIHLSRITDQLQEEVMRIRLLPVAKVFAKFPRLVRDLARKAGKQAELVMRGEDTELDRSVIEQISDPLVHLLRNAMDHGVELPGDRLAAGKAECGVIRVTARHEEGRIILTVEDDGRGIDAPRVKAAAVQKGLIGEAEAASLTRQETLDLIFRPALSTAAIVNEVSGRGVGLDVVRTNIERLNGSIIVDSWPGKGTRFQIVLPLTLAIIPTLLVQAGGEMFAIPLSAVMEALRLGQSDLHAVRGRPVAYLRGRALPLAPLDALLGLAGRSTPRGVARGYVVAVRWGKLEMGLIVDRLIGEQEVVVKPLGALVGDTPGVSGAAILGDGGIALIADVSGLFRLAS